MAIKTPTIKKDDPVWIIGKDLTKNPEKRIVCSVDSSVIGRTIVFTMNTKPGNGRNAPVMEKHDLGERAFSSLMDAYNGRVRLMNRKQPLNWRAPW